MAKTRWEDYFEVRFRGGNFGRSGGVTYADTLPEAAARRAELLAEGRYDVRVYRLRRVRSRVKEEELAAAAVAAPESKPGGG